VIQNPSSLSSLTPPSHQEEKLTTAEEWNDGEEKQTDQSVSSTPPSFHIEATKVGDPASALNEWYQAERKLSLRVEYFYFFR
jgi:hypothetical protein